MKEYRTFLGVRQWLIPLAIALFVAAPFILSSDYSMVIIFVMMAIGGGILAIVGSVHETYNDVKAPKSKRQARIICVCCLQFRQSVLYFIATDKAWSEL